MKSLKKLAILPQGTMIVTDARGDEVVDEVTGEKWSITLHSPGTKIYHAALHIYETNNRAAAVSAMKGEAGNTAEQEAINTAQFLASVTASFNGFDYEGKTGYEAYKAAYLDIEIGHVAKKVNKYLGNEGNFLPPKAPTSSSTSDTQPG